MEIVDSAPELTSEMELARRKLRQRWELASVLSFLTKLQIPEFAPSSCSYSKRRAGGTGYAVPENTRIGAKNRLRQRPIVNTAAECVLIPDSEDEN